MQTGFPLAVWQSNQNSVLGTTLQRPNVTCVSAETSGLLESRLGKYMNPAAFSTAPQFTFVNVSRTIPLRGPGMANVDFSMFKTFDLSERFKAQFRAEVFNLTNTPQFLRAQHDVWDFDRRTDHDTSEFPAYFSGRRAVLPLAQTSNAPEHLMQIFTLGLSTVVGDIIRHDEANCEI
jgi:hypothetical protein